MLLFCSDYNIEDQLCFDGSLILSVLVKDLFGMTYQDINQIPFPSELQVHPNRFHISHREGRGSSERGGREGERERREREEDVSARKG